MIARSILTQYNLILNHCPAIIAVCPAISVEYSKENKKDRKPLLYRAHFALCQKLN